MKIRSLLLGSVAAAGLASGVHAADLGVLTSLDVCDALGLAGLTISSDTNCLQITGEVKYEFHWGDYKGDGVTNLVTTTQAGAFTIVDNDGVPGTELDWYSKVEAYLKFVGTADSDFGPARAVIKIKDIQEWETQNEAFIPGKDNPYTPAVDPLPGTGGDHTFGPIFDEAYVQIGDATLISAGRKGSIIQKGDDEDFLAIVDLFNSEKVDAGVKWSVDLPDGGHVIQVESTIGDGVVVGLGLENLQATAPTAGTAVGYISYAGDGITAHITGIAGGVLDGTIDHFAVHAGFTGTFDMFKIRAAVAADETGYWNALATAEATFDIFTLAVAGEAARDIPAASTDFGFGASASVQVSDGVTFNLAGRYYNDASGPDGLHLAAQIVAAVTETITLTGEAGWFSNNAPAPLSVFYGAAKVEWSPGGGFTSSLKGEAYSNGGYKATFKAAKSFE
jgi:hypothetical protein